MNTYIAKANDRGVSFKIDTNRARTFYTIPDYDIEELKESKNPLAREVANWEFYFGYEISEKTLVHKMVCNEIEALQWLYEHQDEWMRVKS